MAIEYPHIFPILVEYPKMTPIVAEYPRGYSATIEPKRYYTFKNKFINLVLYGYTSI